MDIKYLAKLEVRRSGVNETLLLSALVLKISYLYMVLRGRMYVPADVIPGT